MTLLQKQHPYPQYNYVLSPWYEYKLVAVDETDQSLNIHFYNQKEHVLSTYAALKQAAPVLLEDRSKTYH